MAFFSKALKTALSIFSVRSSERANRSPEKRSAATAFEEEDEDKASTSNKRRRLTSNFEESHDSHGGRLEERSSTSVHNTSNVESRAQSDRMLMPPPSMPSHSLKKPRRTTHKGSRASLDLAESASQATRSSRTGRHDILDEYDMEEARRKAAATELPPNSGIWETGERELFFHLSYRGFEPLIPKHWMIDFPTLPLPVFAHQDEDVPIIECHRSTQFRAIRALRELIDTGTQIRDRTVSSHTLGTELRAEPILERAVNKYISWALKDMGFPDTLNKNSIPVHAIATLQPGESAHHVIEELATQMHLLATRHRAAINIQTSIEQQHSPAESPDNSDETRILPDTDSNGPSLPIIYGVMIASSVLAVFTLNSHVSFPPRLIRKLVYESQTNLGLGDSDLTAEEALRRHPDLTPELARHIARNVKQRGVNSSATANNDDGDANDDDDSGIRYIASFDFSDAPADVWNAFVIAIVAMQIRKTQTEVYQTWARIKEEQQQQQQQQDVQGYDSESEPHTPRKNGIAHRTVKTPGTQKSLDVGEESWLSNIDGVTSPYLGIVGHAEIYSPPSEISGSLRGRRKRGITDLEDDDPDA